MVFYGLGAVQSSSRVDNNCPLIGIRSTLDGWTDWHDMALGSSAHVHCYLVVNNNGNICPSSLSSRVQFEPVAKLSVQYGQLFGMACIWIVPKWLIKVSWIVHLSLIEIVNRVQLNPGYIVPRRHFANWMRLRVICIGLVPLPLFFLLQINPLCVYCGGQIKIHRVLSGQGNGPPLATTVPLTGLQMMFAKWVTWMHLFASSFSGEGQWI